MYVYFKIINTHYCVCKCKCTLCSSNPLKANMTTSIQKCRYFTKLRYLRTNLKCITPQLQHSCVVVVEHNLTHGSDFYTSINNNCWKLTARGGRRGRRHRQLMLVVICLRVRQVLAVAYLIHTIYFI